MIRAEEPPGHAFMDAAALSRPIKMMAPGQEIRLWFDSMGKPNRAELDHEFVATVTGTDFRGKPLEHGEFILDANWGLGGLYPQIHNLHWIGFRIAGIEKSLASINEALREHPSPNESQIFGSHDDLPDHFDDDRGAAASRRVTRPSPRETD